MEYANNVFDKLNDNNIRCELDSRDEKLGYKMRESQTKKIPYTLDLGDKEKENNMITYRVFGSQDSKTVTIDEFVKMTCEKIKYKSIN